MLHPSYQWDAYAALQGVNVAPIVSEVTDIDSNKWEVCDKQLAPLASVQK